MRICAYLWAAHLRQAVLCVLRILWEYSCSPTDFTLHRWLGCVGFPTEFTDLTELLAEKNLPRNPQKLGCAIGCVGLTGMPYPPNLCASVQSVGGPSQPDGSVCSAYSVGIFMFSHRFHGSAQMVRLCRFSHGIHGSHRITC